MPPWISPFKCLLCFENTVLPAFTYSPHSLSPSGCFQGVLFQLKSILHFMQNHHVSHVCFPSAVTGSDTILMRRFLSILKRCSLFPCLGLLFNPRQFAAAWGMCQNLGSSQGKIPFSSSLIAPQTAGEVLPTWLHWMGYSAADMLD